MKISNLDLNKLFLAPMVEITYSPFRKICKEFGAGLTFTQMISAKGVVENNFDTLRYLVFEKGEKPIGVQIVGNNPDIIKDAVFEIKKYKPDLIDFNCGCSANKVYRNNMGSSLLENPDLLKKIVKALVNAAGNIPVSIKIRLGKDQKNINALEISKIIEDNGASLITVHAKTKSDCYGEESNWVWLKKIKENVQIPVLGNGAVFSAKEAKRMKEETGVDSVMVARGALLNPFIFKQFEEINKYGVIKTNPIVDDFSELAIRHLNMLVYEFGEMEGLRRAKKFIIWYFTQFNGISDFIKKVLSEKHTQNIIEIINAHTLNIKNKRVQIENLKEINRKFKERVMYWVYS